MRNQKRRTNGARYARDMQNEAYQSANGRQVKQEVIDLKDELQMLKRKIWELSREWIYSNNGIKLALQSFGIKRLKVAEEEIKAEVNKRVLEQMRRYER